MKNTHELKHITHPTDAESSVVSRYQIYQQTRAGVFLPGVKTDSAVEIVEAFLNQSPAFEGGELRIWNHREQRMSASAEWSTERIDSGSFVRHRTNVFHDRLLGVIARQKQERETLYAAVRQETGMTLAV
jgi:hypothetical protein